MASVVKTTHDLSGRSSLELTWTAGAYHKIEIFFHNVIFSNKSTSNDMRLSTSVDGGTTIDSTWDYHWQRGEVGGGGSEGTNRNQSTIPSGSFSDIYTGVTKFYGLDRSDFYTVFMTVDSGSAVRVNHFIGRKTTKGQENYLKMNPAFGSFVSGYVTVLKWFTTSVDIQTFKDFAATPDTTVIHTVPTGLCVTDYVWTKDSGGSPHFVQMSNDGITYDTALGNYGYGQGTYLINVGGWPSPIYNSMVLDTTTAEVGYYEIYGMGAAAPTVACGATGGGGYNHEIYVTAHTLDLAQQSLRGYSSTAMVTMNDAQVYITSYGGAE